MSQKSNYPLYTVECFDQVKAGISGTERDCTIRLFATSEDDALKKAAKMVKREEYRVVGVDDSLRPSGDGGITLD